MVVSIISMPRAVRTALEPAPSVAITSPSATFVGARDADLVVAFRIAVRRSAGRGARSRRGSAPTARGTAARGDRRAPPSRRVDRRGVVDPQDVIGRTGSVGSGPPPIQIVVAPQAAARRMHRRRRLASRRVADRQDDIAGTHQRAQCRNRVGDVDADGWQCPLADEHRVDELDGDVTSVLRPLRGDAPHASRRCGETASARRQRGGSDETRRAPRSSAIARDSTPIRSQRQAVGGGKRR